MEESGGGANWMLCLQTTTNKPLSPVAMWPVGYWVGNHSINESRNNWSEQLVTSLLHENKNSNIYNISWASNQNNFYVESWNMKVCIMTWSALELFLICTKPCRRQGKKQCELFWCLFYFSTVKVIYLAVKTAEQPQSKVSLLPICWTERKGMQRINSP